MTDQAMTTTSERLAGEASPIGARIEFAARSVAGTTLGAAIALVGYASLGGLIPGDMLRAVICALGAGIGVGLAMVGLWGTSSFGSSVEQRARRETGMADSLRDSLTGLGNHRAFHEDLQRQVSVAERGGTPLALVLIDLDEFKQINDQRGLADGDRALAGFARLVSSAARGADRCFRTGGDEFALILPQTDADGALVLARRLLIQTLEPTPGDETAIPVSFSAGISSTPALATSPERLHAQAEAALQSAKRAGRTDALIFDPELVTDGTSVGSGDAVTELIAQRRVTAAYQPIIELSTGKVLGWEGLIRPIAPSPFPDPTTLLAAAEASGQLIALDFACVETIVAGAGRLPEEAFLSINLSPRTLEAPEFSTAALLTILERHGLEPGRLVIELTERQPIRDLERVLVKLDTFRRAGIRLAADDVGAGNAGLRMLTDLHFDLVKVDLGLVHHTVGGGRASAVVESIVAFAARTGALVVGEGVEDADQIDQLLALHVPAAQGFLLGRPGPLPESTGGEIPEMMQVTELQAAARKVDDEMLTWRQSLGLPPSPILNGQ